MKKSGICDTESEKSGRTVFGAAGLFISQPIEGAVLLPNLIARELSLSVKTVSMFRARALNKLEMRHNAEMTHYAVANRLVEVNPA